MNSQPPTEREKYEAALRSFVGFPSNFRTQGIAHYFQVRMMILLTYEMRARVRKRW